ncbi:MAG: hypothetical protein EOP42_05100 [Sphingobacteriaceae bacterium]|nr:MAG: hypothetical protein EOP42_05100 [Sphingobacteriaceae bacterium]
MRKIYIFLAVLTVFSCTNDKKENSQTVTSTSASSGDAAKNTAASSGASAVADKNLSASDPKQNLVGQWKEHWGVGVETNVKSNDVYQIELSEDGNLSITTSNKKKYKIDQLLFDGRELSFRKQNKLYPLGKFYVYYKLKLRDDFKWMEGPITNNKKQKDFVKWEKVDPEN